MPRTEKYFIGPQLLGDIRRVVGRVESEPYRVNGVKQEVRLQDMRQPGGGGGSGLRLGKVTAAWSKDSLRDVVVYRGGAALFETASNPAEVLTGCVNKFSDVDANKWVMVGLFNGSYYLIAAEC